jgi:hypothetical protein
MTIKHRLALFAVLAIVYSATPARAGQFWFFGHDACAVSYLDEACYRHVQHVIHHKEGLIAYLEADPDVDDGYKSAIITGARAKIHRLRATIGIRHIVWPTPCCYSRRPIYLR